VCTDLGQPRNALGKRLRAADCAVLVWSGPGGGGGARIAELAHALGFEDRPGCGAFHLPATPNGHGVALAWSAASETEESNPQPIKLLVVSGDEAAADPNVRALAEDAERVVAITMFHELAAGWADLILPATAALERDGTSMNLEGRVQRLRRAVPPPCPDELAWISRLGHELGVDISAYAAEVFAELAEGVFKDLSLEDLSARAPLPARQEYEAPAAATTPTPQPLPSAAEGFVGELRLLRYRPLFAGPGVERVRELQFQRPLGEVEISLVDADRRGIATGDTVRVSSNGTSVELRARVNRKLVQGVARIAEEHAGDLHPSVEVAKT
jgi:anaerobic selenocysteine-containing dehydrogenase